MAGLTAIT